MARHGTHTHTLTLTVRFVPHPIWRDIIARINANRPAAEQRSAFSCMFCLPPPPPRQITMRSDNRDLTATFVDYIQMRTEVILIGN